MCLYGNGVILCSIRRCDYNFCTPCSYALLTQSKSRTRSTASLRVQLLTVQYPWRKVGKTRVGCDPSGPGTTPLAEYVIFTGQVIYFDILSQALQQYICLSVHCHFMIVSSRLTALVFHRFAGWQLSFQDWGGIFQYTIVVHFMYVMILTFFFYLISHIFIHHSLNFCRLYM